MNPVHRWITTNTATLDELGAFGAVVGDADIVGLGCSVRHAHELSELAGRMLAYLVTHRGFRALALEGDERAAALLDEFVRTGSPDPAAVLAKARPFLRTTENLALIRWVRAFNEQHPDDPVRVAHGSEPSGDIERALAENTLAWQRKTGQRIVYIGGMAHTAVANSRYVPPDNLPRHSAGSHLRAELGWGYRSIGLMFGAGSAGYEFPLPGKDFAESAFRGAGAEFLLDLRAPAPPPVRAWLHEPALTRLIGPSYDPAHDVRFHMAGGSLAAWFDAVAYVPTVSPVHELTELTGR